MLSKEDLQKKQEEKTIQKAEEKLDTLNHLNGKLNIRAERQEDESYDDFLVRRKLVAIAIKQKLKGKNIHTSKIAGLNLKGKTYYKPTNK